MVFSTQLNLHSRTKRTIFSFISYENTIFKWKSNITEWIQRGEDNFKCEKITSWNQSWCISKASPHKWIPVAKVDNTLHMKTMLFYMKNDSNRIILVKMHALYENIVSNEKWNCHNVITEKGDFQLRWIVFIEQRKQMHGSKMDSRLHDFEWKK